MKKLVVFSSLAFISLTSCNTLLATHTLSTIFLSYAPSGKCPDLSITNYGGDAVSFSTGNKSNILVEIGMSSPLSPIVGSQTIDGKYVISGGTIKNSEPYYYDFGFKCSSKTPELRQKYISFSTVTVTEDSTTPSGIAITVQNVNQ